MLRKLRKARGLSMMAVAESVDYDQGNLSRIETGLRVTPPSLARRLAEFYGVSLDVIYGSTKEDRQ